MAETDFLDDIHAQPETLSQLCERYVASDHTSVLSAAAAAIRASGMPICLTGMGASYFSLVAMKTMLDRAGIQAVLEDTDYLIEYGRRSIRPGQPVVVVSQSGRTGEALGLTQQLGDHAPLIVVTNDPSSELARRAQFLLPLFARPDGGVAIKTYTASLALLAMLAEAIVERDHTAIAAKITSGGLMDKAIAKTERMLEHMTAFAEGNGHTTLLGRGPSFASALAGALLLKETAKLPAEGATAAQFRHGAIEVVTRLSFVVLFSPNGTVSHLNTQLVGQLERSGAHILIIGPASGGSSISCLDVEIEVPDEYLAPIFEIVPLQFLSHALAIDRGIRPGTFINTTPIVLTR